ncbi:MAG: hypothetical protein H6734_25965 [Alphaproteobacteria bacterium]|nr:hypothetical protein [Alphaproteobacteria bacterium]
MTHRQVCRLACGTLLVALAPGSARAYSLLERDALKLELRGLGEAGVQANTSQDSAGYVNVARLMVVAKYSGMGRVMVQYEMKNGRPELLDAQVEVTPFSSFMVTAGRFKTPVSLEFAIPAPKLRFHRRAALKSLVPTRANGLDVGYEHDLGDVSLGLQLGAFLTNTDLSSGIDDGVLATARAYARLPYGVTLHVAGADHLFSMAPTEDSMHQEAVIDVAASWEHGGWGALAEGVVVVDETDGPRPYGLYAMAAHRFVLDMDIGLEPAVAYDQIRSGDNVNHFGTVAFNVYWLDYRLVTSVDYRGGRDDGATSHAGFARLQIGF